MPGGLVVYPWRVRAKLKGLDTSGLPEDLDLFEDSEQDEPESLLLIGSLVGGKYVIKRVLGSGGNGAVYEGEHSAIGHRVAIKVARLSQKERAHVLARFSREARICGSLRHPNVGQVYDVGMLDDGSPFMVMELQEGRSLAEVFDEMQLPIVALVDIARQVLAGLAAAHAAGVVHRDVKPDNVMIVRDVKGDVVVKLVDFGISKTLPRGWRSRHGRREHHHRQPRLHGARAIPRHGHRRANGSICRGRAALRGHHRALAVRG